MNGMLLQLVASGAALSLMGGAVTVHYVHVQEVSSAFGEEAQGHDGLELVSLESEREISSNASSAPMQVAVAKPQPSEKEVTLELLQSMVDQIESLSRENNALREEHSVLAEQVAEANRDLSQLQFRVDTHSESFRPLRVSDSTLREYRSDHPVLPPKNWNTAQAADGGWRTGGQ